MVRNVDNPAPSVPGTVISTPQQISQRTLVVLERQVDDAIAQRVAAVNIDLAATQIIDSVGLNWLATTHARLATANIPLRLIEIPLIVSDILMATRLDARFTILTANGNGEGVKRA